MNQKARIIIPLVLGTFMAALDNSIVNISLPVMQKEFGVQVDDMQWVITAYMLAFCVFMPLTNWLKNKVGLYTMYVGSIALFTFGSLLCGISSNLEMLIGARIIQALGGGALTPVALAMLSAVFDEKERGSVMGLWGLGVVVGPALGPTLGGLLTQYFGWPSIFFVNIPFGILAFLLSMKYLKKIGERSGSAPPFDLQGYILFIIFITLLQYSVSQIEKIGFYSPVLYLTTSFSIVSLLVFIYRETHTKHPVLDLSLFKRKQFNAGILVTAIRSVALFGGLFLLPFLLQELLGFSELQSGLLLLPTTITIAILMPFAGKWADKHGPRQITIAGILLIALSTFQLAFLDPQSSLFTIILPMILRGVGLGFLFSPVSAAVINAAPKAHSATASSYYSLLMQIGGSIGISILAVVHQALLKTSGEAADCQAAGLYAIKGSFLLATGIILLSLWPAFLLQKNVPELSQPPEEQSADKKQEPVSY